MRKATQTAAKARYSEEPPGNIAFEPPVGYNEAWQPY